MKRDPPVRTDGRCAHCLGERKMPAAGRHALGAVYEADPFCSSSCARAWHGAPVGANLSGVLGYRGGDKPGGSPSYGGGDK